MGSFQRHRPTFQPPKMTTHLSSNSGQDASVDIQLPAKAQDGDWLLIPDCPFWFMVNRIPASFRGMHASKVAFLARNYETEKFEVLGKALIANCGSHWRNGLEKEASKFKFFCDQEDLLVLCSLCNWAPVWNLPEWKDSDSFNALRNKTLWTKVSLLRRPHGDLILQ
jgi:hypothetical protein